MNLQEQIDSRAREIRTDGYAMSIGEVLTLCNDGDIDIHPEFQRIFRWNDSQKSRLIESILLGIPIPSIFVSQRQDGIWDVIDGVQRLSTILEFTGNLTDSDGTTREPFQLETGEYLSEMEGFKWRTGAAEIDGDDSKQNTDKAFSDALRRDFKRAKLEFRIITKGSDVSAKYDLFQRLNSGSVLSPQEARNCLLVMINSEMFSAVRSLATSENFLSTVPLSERQEEQAYREELVLRFFAQRDFEGGDTELRQEYGEYLTNWMRQVAQNGGLSTVDIKQFEDTFNFLNEALGEDTFRRWNGERHLGPFSISGYEFITSGLISNLNKLKLNDKSQLVDLIKGVWKDESFKRYSGTGNSPRRRVPRLINRSRDYFG